MYLNYLSRPHKTVRIAITGKYTDLHDSYVSILNALDHSKVKLDVNLETEWIDTSEYSDGRPIKDNILDGISGIIAPGGFGERGAEGKIRFIPVSYTHLRAHET